MRDLFVMTLLFTMTSLACGPARAQNDLRAGFLLEAPLLEQGLTRSHEQARQQLAGLTGVSTSTAVIAADQLAVAVEQFITAEVDVIIATSASFREQALEAARRHPTMLFVVYGEASELSNVASFSAQLDAVFYLQGIIAGGLTLTDRVAFLASQSDQLAAFRRGLELSNPEAEVLHQLLPGNFDANFAQHATQTVIDQGADVFIFMDDSEAILRQAAKRGLPSFAYATAMLDPEHEYVVSGQLYAWQVVYRHIIELLRSGSLDSNNLNTINLRWGMPEGLVLLGANRETLVHKDYQFALANRFVQHRSYGEISIFELLQQEYDHLQQ